MNRNIFNRSGFSLIGFCRNKALRKVLATWCAFATLATTCAPAFASTTYTEFNSELNNVSGNISVDGFAGNGNIGSSDLTTINIDTSDGLVGVLDWAKFNIPGEKTMNFGLVVGGTFYNIVDSAGGATAIQGALNGANAANVYIFNPNGVLIGNGAVVDVGGLFGAIAAGINNTGDMITDPTTTIDIGPTVGNITIEGGKILNDALLLGKNVTIDGTIDANNLQFGGDVVIGAGDAIVIDSIGGGTVSFTPSSTTAVNVDLMGAFAKNLSVKASTASVTVDGDLAVGTDSVGDFTIAGADLTVTDNGAVDVEGALTVEKTVAQEGDITVGGNFSVGGNTLTVTTGDLDVGGDLTVKSGTGKVAQDGGTITVAGANGISANVTQDGENTAVKLSAAKISGDVTQKKGSMGIVKTAEVGGDYHMYGGELKSYTDNGDITINGELEQTFESAINVGTGTLVLKGGATQANKDDVGITAGTVELAGAGTETVNLLGNANEIGSIKGSADAVTIDNGATAVTVSEDLTVNSLTVAKLTQDGEGKTITSAAGNDLVIKGEVTQKAGTIAAASSQKVTIDGAFVQNQSDEKTAGLGDANNAVEITGDLTQTKGTITASTLTLDGAATQTEGAKVVATTAVALNAADKDVALNSSVNDIAKVTGTAGSVDVATTKGVTLDTLSTSGDTKVTANDGTVDQTITFVGINSADKYDLTGSTVGQAASSTVTADEVALTASGAVTLDDTTGNAIEQVSGTAASVSVVTTTGLKVTDLDTGNGAMTFDAGANEVEFTGTAAAGTITLNSAAKQTSGSITATKIANSATTFTQNGGTITTPEVTGAFTQNGGTIAAAAPAAAEDPNTTLTFGGAVVQKFAADGSDPAVIGLDSRRNDVVFNGSFKQNGEAEGKTVAPILNAGTATFNADIAEGDVNGTLNVNEINGSASTIVLTPDKIGDDFTLSSGTLKVNKVGDNFTQEGGTLTAKGSSGITFAGDVTQKGGQIGESTAPVAIEIKGDLDQTDGTDTGVGEIYATTLKLAGNAQQDANAKVVANQLAVGTGSVLLTSIKNAIDQVTSQSAKTATALTLQTTTDLNVTALSVSGNTTLTAIDGTTAKDVEFDGDNALATGVSKTLTVTGNDVTENAGATLATTKLALAAEGDVTIKQTGNAIYEVGGTAASVDLRTATTLDVIGLNTGASGDATIQASKDSLSATYKASEYYDVKLDGNNVIGGTFDVSSAKLTQDGGTLKTGELALPATVVTLTQDGNQVAVISGTAESVNLKNMTDVSIGNLTTSGDTKIVAVDDVTDSLNPVDKNIDFAGTTTAAKYDLTGANVTQSAGTVAADEVTLATSGSVTLNQANNDIKKVDGAATAVTLVTSKDIEVGDLNTGNGAITITATDGSALTTETVTFSGTVAAGTGAITVNDADVFQKVGAGSSITAKTLNLNGTGNTLNGTVTATDINTTAAAGGNNVTIAGTVKADNFGIDVVQTAGTINRNGTGPLTFNRSVTQTGGKIGDSAATYDVVMNGALDQDPTGEIYADNLAINEDSDVASKVVASGTDGKITVAAGKTLTQSGGLIDAKEIDVSATGSKFDLQGGTTSLDTFKGNIVQDTTDSSAIFKVNVVNGGVTQKATNKGSIAAKDSSAGLTIKGDVTQESATAVQYNTGTIGTADADLTIDGLLTQNAGTIKAKTLMLSGGASQAVVAAPAPEVAKIEATTLVANKNTADITALSRDNKFGTLEGTGKDIKIVDSEGGLTIGALTANSLDAKVTGDVTGTSAISLAGGSSQNSKIDATGKIELKNATSDLHNDGTAAAGYIDLDAADVIIEAKDVSLGTVSANKNPSAGTVSVTVSGDLVANGKVDAKASAADAVTLKSTGGAVTLKDTVTAGGGNIKISGTTVTADDDISNVTVGNIEITGTKDITLSGNVTAKNALTVTGDNDITTVAGKTLQGESVTVTGDADGDADGDPLVNGTGKADMKAVVKATGGDVTVAGYDVEFADKVEANKDITVTAANDLTTAASKTVSGQNVTLTATANDATINGTVTASVGDVTIAAGNDVALAGTASLEANKKLTVEAGNDIEDAAATTALSAKDLVLTADKDANNTGKVEIKGVVTATGTTTLSAAGDISLANAANDFNGTVTADNTIKPATTPGNIALKDASDLKLGSVTAAGGVSAIAVSQLSVLDNATVSAANGDIVLTAGSGNNLSIGDSAIVSAAPGTGTTANMTLTAGNDVFIGDGASLSTTLASGGTATIAITADNKINLSDKPATTGLKASIAAGGDLTAHAKGGDITTAADTSITVGGDLDADADNGAIAINGTIAVAGDADFTAKTTVTALNAGNDFDSDGSFGTDGKGKVSATATEVQLKEANDIVLGNITTTSANTGIKVETVDGDITVVGALKSQQPGTQNAASIKLTAKDANDDHTGGSIDVASTGSIISDTNVELLADEDAPVAGDITASNGKVEITAEDGDASLTSASLTANNGDVKVEAKGAITVSGLSTGTGVADISASKAVSLKAGAGTGDVTIYTDGTIEAKNGGVTIENAVGDVEVGGATVNAKQATTAPVPLTDVNVIVKATTGDVKITKDANNNGAALTAENKVEVLGNGQVKVDTPTSLTANKDYVKVIATTKDASVDGTVTAATYAQIEATADKAAVGGTVTANDGDITVTAGKAIMIDGALTAKDGGTTGAGDIVVTANGNDAPATPATAVLITTAGSLTADKSITITATDTSAASAITIDTTGAVTAKDGSVTINNANGDVTIKNATVKALDASAAADTTLADIDIDATGAVVVDAATLSADDNVLVGDNATPTPHPVASFAAQNGASVTAAKNVEIYSTGNATIAKGTGSRTEVVGLTGVTVDAGGFVDVDAAVVKAGDINETTGAFTGSPANLSVSAGDYVKVEKGALVGASGTATVTAAGDDSTAAKNGVVVTGTGTKLVSQDNMSISTTSAGGAAIEVSDKAYVATHGTMGVTATGKVTVKDTTTVVESTKAMTVSGTDVEIDNARLGTSDTLSVTATAAGGDIDVKNAAQITAAKNTTLTAGNDVKTAAASSLTVGNSTTASDLSVTATAGKADFDGVVTVAGKTTFTAAGIVDAANTANDFVGDVMVVSGTDVTLKDVNSITIADVTSTGANGITATGKVDIDGTAVTVNDAIVTDGSAGTGKDVTIDASTGDITINAAVSSTDGTGGAGDVKVTAAAGDVNINSADITADNDVSVVATAGDVTATATAPATANIVAGNDASVSAGGNATLNDVTAGRDASVTAATGTATANDVTGGRVASVNANGNVTVNDVNAGTGNANVSSTAGNVVANDVKSASNTAGVIAIAGDVTANDVSGTITTVTANGNATVNDVTATAGNANITATTGNITANDVSATVDATINANGNTTVNNVTATTGNAVVKATTGSANATGTVAAGGQADVLAGTTANASFDSTVVNVQAGSSANVNVLAGGVNNPSGNMTIDADTYTAAAGTSSVVAGGDLNLNVAGNLTTAGSAEIHAGGNLDVKAASASSPLNIDVGGSTIGIDLTGQDAVALNDHGKNYTVKGNDSHTAIFIDGRLAGGDPRYFSILSSYEGEVARGVVTGPLAVPYVSNIFAAPFITLDLPLAVPGILGQSYMQGEAGSIDAGVAFPEADTALSIPGLPANSTIFFIPREEAKNKTAAL